MAPAEHSDLGSGKDPRSDCDLLQTWAAAIDKDPDLGTDVRKMVPVFYDVERSKTVDRKKVRVEFAGETHTQKSRRIFAQAERSFASRESTGQLVSDNSPISS